jgi:hypothetical protein
MKRALSSRPQAGLAADYNADANYAVEPASPEDGEPINDPLHPGDGLARDFADVVSVERRTELVVRPGQPAGLGVLELRNGRAHDRREVPELDVP